MDFPFLNAIINAARRHLIDVIIHGSAIERDDFDEKFSDVDLLLIISDKSNLREVLRALSYLPLDKRIDISIYWKSFVKDEFLKGEPFFGATILYGKSVLNSKFVKNLRRKGFKFSAYTIYRELVFFSLVLPRIIMDLKDNEIISAVNRSYHLAKYALATVLMIKTKSLIVRFKDIIRKAQELGFNNCASYLIELRNNRKNIRNVHDALKYFNDCYDLFRNCLSEYIDFSFESAKKVLSKLISAIYVSGKLNHQGIKLVYICDEKLREIIFGRFNLVLRRVVNEVLKEKHF